MYVLDASGERGEQKKLPQYTLWWVHPGLHTLWRLTRKGIHCRAALHSFRSVTAYS